MERKKKFMIEFSLHLFYLHSSLRSVPFRNRFLHRRLPCTASITTEKHVSSSPFLPKTKLGALTPMLAKVARFNSLL
jgi:hypothetical protein